MGRLRAIKAKHKFLVADSCFSGNLLTRGIAVVPKARVLPSRFVLEKSALVSVQGLSSGGNEPVSDGGPEWNGHSIFAYHLLGQLRANQKPYLSANLLGFEVSEKVANDTNSVFGSSQTPIFSTIKNQGDQGGDFFFVADPDTIRTHQKPILVAFAEAGPGGPDSKFTGAFRWLDSRLRQELTALYVPVAHGNVSIPGRMQLEGLTKAVVSHDASGALVVALDGELKREPTVMWQGHTTVHLSLDAYRVEGGRLIRQATYVPAPQRLPTRAWRQEDDFARQQLADTTAKVLEKAEPRELLTFLEALRN